MPSFSLFPRDSSSSPPMRRTSRNTRPKPPDLDPLTPPTIIPLSSPVRLSPGAARPSPPADPSPWVWRCHNCLVVYRLATTRRCLECDHEFCVTAGAPPRTKSGRRKKSRRGGGPCRNEFDYVGWAARGAWRRTILLNKDTTKNNSNSNKLTPAWGNEYRAAQGGDDKAVGRFHDRRDALFVRKRHSCWLHCNFPSECKHAIYHAQKEGRPVLAAAEALDKMDEAVAHRRRSRHNAKADAEEEEEEEQEQEQEAGAAAISPCSPATTSTDLPMDETEVSPLRPTSDRKETAVSPTADGAKDDGFEDVNLDGDSIYEPTGFFATTAAPVEVEPFADSTGLRRPGLDAVKQVEDIEPDDNMDEDLDDMVAAVMRRRYQDRRGRRPRAMVSQPTGVQLESFEPFETLTIRRRAGDVAQDAAGELESAYSEKAWWSSSGPGSHAQEGRRRHESSDKMTPLISRRTSPTIQGRDGAESEDWDSWSDSSSASSSSGWLSSISSDEIPTPSEGSERNFLPPPEEGRDATVAVDDDDGDSLMYEAPPVSDEGEDALSPDARS